MSIQFALTVKNLQEQAKELGSNFPETTIEQRAMFLITEIGEVAEEVLALSGAYKEVDVDRMKENLGLEMYDVIWNLCDLANMVGIDLEEAFESKIELNRRRTWG